jgi:hypothetical protein
MKDLITIEEMFRNSLKGRVIKEVNLVGTLKGYDLELLLSKDKRPDIKLIAIKYNWHSVLED